MTPNRIVVGAHYGWRDWLVQRVSAVVMALYTLLILALLLWFGGLDYAAWKAAFGSDALSFAPPSSFILSLLWHAWVGMRNICMDYVKPVGVRLDAASRRDRGAGRLSRLDDPGALVMTGAPGA